MSAHSGRTPSRPRANLRLGILLSWEGKLDSSLVLISRARSGDPNDAEMGVIHARIRSWDQQYGAALALYDSVLARSPGLRDAELGKAQTLAWAGRLGAADSAYERLISRNASDRDARLGHALVSAWQGKLGAALKEYSQLLAQNPRDVDALAGSAQVYYWQGKIREARRQAGAALAVDSTHRAARELRRTLDEAVRPKLEGTAAWSNDSDHNTSFWQNLGTTVLIASAVSAFGSVNALETSDPVLEATRVGGEAGMALSLGQVSATAAGGARRLMPEIAPDRTSATYRGRVSYRPVSPLGLHLGYSRMPFDETAALIEQALDMELLEGGFDARPFRGFSLYASGSETLAERWEQPQRTGSRDKPKGSPPGYARSVRPDLELRAAGRGVFLPRSFFNARSDRNLQRGYPALGWEHRWRARRPAGGRGRRSAGRVARGGPARPGLGIRQPGRAVRPRYQQRGQLDHGRLPISLRGPERAARTVSRFSEYTSRKTPTPNRPQFHLQVDPVE